jgi:hypothetical protein
VVIEMEMICNVTFMVDNMISLDNIQARSRPCTGNNQEIIAGHMN